uniref:Uncharacterized protein n=1 Tax=Solanum lycopersicum TaxID=4081 RepID=A0A3Q7I3Z3_SOLLC
MLFFINQKEKKIGEARPKITPNSQSSRNLELSSPKSNLGAKICEFL